MKAKALTKILKKGQMFMWTNTNEQSFQALKKALATATILTIPHFDKTFVVDNVASDKGIGAVLQQNGHPITYISKDLGPKNQGLSTYDKESLGILMGSVSLSGD
jgi:hypothetical protein